jgi:hypothetical protein
VEPDSTTTATEDRFGRIDFARPAGAAFFVTDFYRVCFVTCFTAAFAGRFIFFPAIVAFPL